MALSLVVAVTVAAAVAAAAAAVAVAVAAVAVVVTRGCGGVVAAGRVIHEAIAAATSRQQRVLVILRPAVAVALSSQLCPSTLLT